VWKEKYIIYGARGQWTLTRNNNIFLPIKPNSSIEMVLKMTIYEQYPFSTFFIRNGLGSCWFTTIVIHFMKTS